MKPTDSDGTLPAFLITIDTEGDNLWSAPPVVTTRNAAFLPRFQALCEKWGFTPTYLTDYSMALCGEFQTFASDGIRRGTLEIGMHLHAWNSPPLIRLTEDDMRYGPYLIEYPEPVMRQKIQYLTAVLEDVFEEPIKSHRAGRWAFNGTYAKILADCSYTVDCSVTPHVSWSAEKGDPAENGGSDYRRFPEVPYYLNFEDIGAPGDSPLLEVPMTIMDSGPWAEKVRVCLPERSLARRVWNRLFPRAIWLRPNGRNLSAMLSLLRRACSLQRPCVAFMLHSSELMPGGSPYFQQEQDIEKLYGDLEVLFEVASRSFRGMGLTEFARCFRFSRELVS